jgi:hypothetical protein
MPAKVVVSSQSVLGLNRRAHEVYACVMNASIVPFRWEPVVGGLLLVFFVLSKIGLVRFRRSAVQVRGVVLKSFGHGKHTSYFLRYEYEGRSRVAEYCGVPLFQEYKIGEELEVLIDSTSPPDVSVPDKCHVATSTEGNCMLPGLRLFTLTDALLLGVYGYLIISGCAL